MTGASRGFSQGAVPGWGFSLSKCYSWWVGLVVVGPKTAVILQGFSTICGKDNGTPLQYSCLKIPWMEEPGRLQSVGSLRVGHDWVTSLSLFTFMHWRRKWQPTSVFLPGESQGWRSLVGCPHGVAQSRTRLKRLSSSSSTIWLLTMCAYYFDLKFLLKKFIFFS